jgi:hypothetical protein
MLPWLLSAVLMLLQALIVVVARGFKLLHSGGYPSLVQMADADS